ncbi:MAG: sulfotransferase domain-containing protein [Hyphomicrobiales bacterium]|nr:sulfotransferase domain-containing protein [Hyphomicrobiales bacterium]
MIVADPNDPRGIVWIASYPKSGNTWVRVFLHHLLRLANGRPLEDHDIDELARTSSAAAGRVELYERFLGKPPLYADPRAIAEVRPRVQQAMVEEAGRIIYVKTHSFLGRVFDQPLINLKVSAGGLYIVRNPLDVAVSLSSHLGVSIDAAIKSLSVTLNASIASQDRAPEIWGSWSENVGSWTTDIPPVILVVRYEDLLADARSRFGDVVRHLRLDVTDDQIDEAVALSSFDRLQAMESTGGFLERLSENVPFFREGRADQWREVLSPEQVERIVTDHGEQMGRFGYLPSH